MNLTWTKSHLSSITFLQQHSTRQSLDTVVKTACELTEREVQKCIQTKPQKVSYKVSQSLFTPTHITSLYQCPMQCSETPQVELQFLLQPMSSAAATEM